jgi:hypothetical protein
MRVFLALRLFTRRALLRAGGLHAFLRWLAGMDAVAQ